jgi:hypothetical protein
MPDFTIPDFLRAIGCGPEERPEWWTGSIMPPSFDEYMVLDCPFADILTDWTHDKDALLLGVALEWLRSREDDHLTIEFQLIEYFNECCWENTLVWINDRPGLTLARAIWAAMKGGEK